MNVGHEEEELKPYIEPEADFSDSSRIGMSEWICTNVALDPICQLLNLWLALLLH